MFVYILKTQKQKKKKNRHKLYGIKRKSEFIESAANLIYNIDNNYSKYKDKANIMLETSNYDAIGSELMLQPNMIVSILGKDHRYGTTAPLLHLSGLLSNSKCFELILSGILHFGLIILNGIKEEQEQEQTQGKKNKNAKKKIPLKEQGLLFIDRYLNYRSGNLFGWNDCWGINTKNGNCSGIKALIECKYCDGYIPMVKRLIKENRSFEGIVYMVDKNCFDLFKIMVDNIDKNKLAIVHGLNPQECYVYNDKHVSEYGVPLLTLTRRKHCNEKWLNLLFKASQLTNVMIKTKTINDTLKECKNKQWKKLIEDYVKRNNIDLSMNDE